MERWLKAKQGSLQKKEQPETSLRSYVETERADTLEECLELQCVELGVGEVWAGEEQNKSNSILKRRTEESQHSKCNGKRRSLNTQKEKYTHEMQTEESQQHLRRWKQQDISNSQRRRERMGKRKNSDQVFSKFTNI